ncbi:MAG: aminotransferase class V-fold PLP-dependent enzyme [Vicinamibacterales bacterium]
MPPLVPTSDFLHLDRVTHLAGGGQTPMLKTSLEALARFAWAKGTGLDGQQVNTAVRSSVAAKVASLLGADPADIGFPSSVAHGVHLLVDSIDWHEGDNVVMEAWEFPSLMFPFLALRARGVEVRLIAPVGWQAPEEDWRAAVDANTRVVAISQVSYLTGEHHDLAFQAELARRVGALFVVDASHALGSVAVEASVADFLFACCYKFVLGVQGAAVAYWNRSRLPDWQPGAMGWHSVVWRAPLERGQGVRALPDGMAFEPGNPAYGALYVLDQSLDTILGLGIGRIQTHTRTLSGELRERLAAAGLPVMTPVAPGSRAGSVAFESARAPQIRERLEAQHVLVSGDEGRVRASVHVYSDAGDVERGAAAIVDAAR